MLLPLHGAAQRKRCIQSSKVLLDDHAKQQATECLLVNGKCLDASMTYQYVQGKRALMCIILNLHPLQFILHTHQPAILYVCSKGPHPTIDTKPSEVHNMPRPEHHDLNHDAITTLEQTQSVLANQFNACVTSIAHNHRERNMMANLDRARDILHFIEWATKMQYDLQTPRPVQRVHALQDENDELRARVEALEKKRWWKPWGGKSKKGGNE